MSKHTAKTLAAFYKRMDEEGLECFLVTPSGKAIENMDGPRLRTSLDAFELRAPELMELTDTEGM